VSAINNPGDNTQSRQVPNPSPDTPPSPTPLQHATIANDTNQLAGTQPLIANNQAVQPPPPVNTPCSKLPCPGPPSPPETREGQKFYGPINQPNMQGGVMPAGLNAPVKPASNAGLIFAIGVSVVAGIGIAAAYFLIPEVRQCVDSHIIHPIRNALPATSDATFTRPQQNSSSGYGRVNDPNRPVIF
jgi:hypothetical protein